MIRIFTDTQINKAVIKLIHYYGSVMFTWDILIRGNVHLEVKLDYIYRVHLLSANNPNSDCSSIDIFCLCIKYNGMK